MIDYKHQLIDMALRYAVQQSWAIAQALAKHLFANWWTMPFRKKHRTVARWIDKALNSRVRPGCRCMRRSPDPNPGRFRASDSVAGLC